MVGIDVASGTSTWQRSAPSCRRRWWVGNDADGHSVLVNGLARLKPELVRMEATGGYEAALACALQAADCGSRW